MADSANSTSDAKIQNLQTEVQDLRKEIQGLNAMYKNILFRMSAHEAVMLGTMTRIDKLSLPVRIKLDYLNVPIYLYNI